MYVSMIQLQELSFQGIPLYADGDELVFVNKLPDSNVLEKKNGEIVRIKKNLIKNFLPVCNLHMTEVFSILSILDENDKEKWKKTLEKIFKNRGQSVRSYLNQIELEKLLVFVDLWQAGDIWVEDDVLLHHSDENGIIPIQLYQEEHQVEFTEILQLLVEETWNKMHPIH